MPDFHRLGDLLDVCLARAEDVIDTNGWLELAEIRSRVHKRIGFLGEVLVVVLAGGTGSGKSSLFNALCGAEVATVGLERPTTSRCLAAIPSGIEGDLEPFMQSLGIDDLVEVDGLDQMVLVDLPDFDSTFTSHREIVDSVLPLVDAAVWVVDPEKYADRLLHEHFLAPLSRYSDQMVFALNQADRLGEHTQAVLTNLTEQLVADGHSSPAVVATVAAADEHTDLDVDALVEALRSRLDVKRSVSVKLCEDISTVANRRWLVLDRVFEDMEGTERSDAAVVMASLVSLGVAAIAAKHEVEEGTNHS
jgi:GTPase Era involved in 16S rRNA processing